MSVRTVLQSWWNRKWGGLVRRDVVIWTNGVDRWAVEARAGGMDGRSRWYTVDTPREAYVLAGRFRDLGGEDWMDTSPRRSGPFTGRERHVEPTRARR